MVATTGMPVSWLSATQRATCVSSSARPEPLQLEVVAIAEQLLPLARQRQRIGFAPGSMRAAHVAFGGTGERDQSRGGLGVEPAALDQRHAAVLALEPGARDQVGDVLVAARVLAQQGQPRRHGAFAAHAQQHVHADDGFDALLQRLAIELHHREEIVLVGDRDRGHAELRGALDQLRNAHHAVLQRELGVQAEVDEARCALMAREFINERAEQRAGVTAAGVRRDSWVARKSPAVPGHRVRGWK